MRSQTSNFKLLPAALRLLDVSEATDCLRLAANNPLSHTPKVWFLGLAFTERVKIIEIVRKDPLDEAFVFLGLRHRSLKF
jgi:hypothetical protein